MAYTPELCSGIVFRTTPTYDTPAYRFGMSHPKIGGLVHVGTKVSGLVALVVDTQTGLRRYCDLREDACYPADAIQLLNCSVSLNRGGTQSYFAIQSSCMMPSSTALLPARRSCGPATWKRLWYDGSDFAMLASDGRRTITLSNPARAADASSAQPWRVIRLPPSSCKGPNTGGISPAISEEWVRLCRASR